MPSRSSSTSRKATWWIGVLTAPNAIPVRESIRAGTPNPTASIPGVAQLDDRLDERVDQRLLRLDRRRALRQLLETTRAVEHSGEDLGAPEVDSYDPPVGHAAGYPTLPDGAGR